MINIQVCNAQKLTKLLM